MWLDEEITITKRDLVLEQPLVNSAGMLGFAPDPHNMPFLPQLGAFITNPISRQRRTPAANRVYLPYPGGFLLHTGFPNPGINRVISRYKRRWAGAPLPVIVHLLVETPESLAEMIRKLEGLENVMGVELGLPPGCTVSELSQFMAAALGELPVILSLNLEQIQVLEEGLSEHPPSALHLIKPRGTFPDSQGNLVTGRLYGPALFPIMLDAVKCLLELGYPLVVDGGITHRWQADAFLNLGVLAVGLGSVLWQVSRDRFSKTQE